MLNQFLPQEKLMKNPFVYGETVSGDNFCNLVAVDVYYASGVTPSA
jgi:hypothetical protein